VKEREKEGNRQREKKRKLRTQKDVYRQIKMKNGTETEIKRVRER
jgi:hypothetical protein